MGPARDSGVWGGQRWQAGGGVQVIKFLVSDHLYQLLPAAHEGVLADTKDTIVSNASLTRFGLRLGLGDALNLPLQCAPPPPFPARRPPPLHIPPPFRGLPCV